MNEWLKDVIAGIIFMLVGAMITYLFVMFLPIWDCGYQLAEYSCTGFEVIFQ